MKKYLPIISSIFIIISFFLGYFYGIQENKISLSENKKEIVSIEEKKGKINIVKSSENIEIYINGEAYTSEK